MNMLIVGGLLAVGLLALIGAILLSLREKPATDAQSAPATATPETIEQQKIDAAPVPAEKPNLPTRREDEESMPPMLNGQLHELATELRTLHQQSVELRQRLGILTEIADHLERSQADRVSVPEHEYVDQ